MPTLSSAIVKKQVASMREVEEALARQVLYGGDLPTNLLELAAVEEGALTRVLADEYQLGAGPSGALNRVSDEILATVPGDVALRHGIYPLALDDRALTLAVSEPIPREVEEDLAFALGLELEQHIVPLVRIRQAIARDYGLPLDRRFLRLIAKLEGKPDPSPSSMPAMQTDAQDLSTLPRPPTVPPIAYPPATELGQAGAVPAPSPKPEETADAETTTTTRTASTAPVEQPAAPPSASQQMRAFDRAKWAAQARAKARRSPSMRPRRRGPYTAAMAEHDLLSAADRDDVLAAFFDFASQYFEYTALFVVQSDIAEGRDAHGPGATPTQVTGIGVPLDLPSSLREVKSGTSSPLAKLSSEGLDARLSKDLQRYVGATVLLLPVHVRGRCVLILYGDDGKRRVELDAVGGVIAFVPLVTKALERIILLKKRAARAAAGLPPSLVPPTSVKPRHAPPPSAEERAQALAGVLSEPAGAPEPQPPPAVTKAPSEPAVESLVPSRTVTVGESRASSTPVPSSTAPARLVLTPPADEEPPEDGWDEPFARAEQGTKPGVGTETVEPVPPSEPVRSSKRLELVPEPDESADQPVAEEEREKEDAADSAPALSVGEADLDEVLPIETSDDLRRAGEAPLAPESRRVAVGPRSLKRRHSSREMRLPSVIVDVESDHKPLVARLLEGDESVVDRLVDGGGPAASALVEKLPGPISSELRRGTPLRPARASECGPVLRALARIGAPAVPFLAVRTNDGDPDVRGWATRLLGEIPTEESARAVAARLLESSPEGRRAAVDAARLLLNDDRARRALCDALLEETDREGRTLAAIESAADLKLGEAVPRLVELLAAGASDVEQSAHWALTVITRTDFGRDREKWQQWWDRFGTKHRIEWLIQSLMHDSAEIRREAGEELKSLTKEYFGYYDDLPKKERRRAQHRYRSWWDTKGKAKFT